MRGWIYSFAMAYMWLFFYCLLWLPVCLPVTIMSLYVCVSYGVAVQVKRQTLCVTVCVVVFACGATRNAGSFKFLYYFSASK